MPVDQPILRASIDGVAVAGAVALRIESVGYFAADRFSLSFAIGASPATTVRYFSTLGLQMITIEAALDGIGYVLLLTGQIDNIQINFAQKIALLSGRDLSARLIDTEISETFANQTASQIATTIAGRHGLTGNITPTPTPVGQYYELDHARSSLGQNSRAATEWNLLTMLAQAEGFSLAVKGTTLIFAPPINAAPVLLTVQDFMALSFDTATSLPQSAQVKSWNSRDKAVISGGAGSGTRTTIIRPNLTATQAQNFAGNHLAMLGTHTTILSGAMPADLSLSPGMQLLLRGTDSALDQNYTISAISRSLHKNSGFTQNILAYAAN